MKTNLYFLFVLSLCLQACKNDAKKTKELTRMEQVMAVHDELMPKMSDLGKLITAIEPKIDSTETGQIYQVAKDSLADAYAYMMEWMKGFGEKFDSAEVLEGKALSAEKEALLLEEEKKVYIMKEMMLGSIDNAEKLLEQSDAK
ncbi:hypothetical protein MWU59_07710 [Flavobacteriaceae bacterium F08102]|nr:hypothetical protein [Flavobacteriaceae bacterium F08102]